MKRLLSILLALCLTISCLTWAVFAAEDDPEVGDMANSWRFENGQWLGQQAAQARYTAYHPDATLTGIDVSSWQGEIDWESVQAAGVDFALIRCGYGMDDPQQDDTRFLYNAAECERLGIPYGVYLYSYATNPERADSEADHVLRLLEGRTLSLPVYYDMEDESTLGTDSGGVPIDLAAIATTFCEKVAAAGYDVGVYASLNWWDNYLTAPCFDNWHRWVAQYNVTCNYKGDFAIWQFSSTGRVNGIGGNVDLNYLIGYPEGHYVDPDYALIRLSGATRYQTSETIANALEAERGTRGFDSIIIASGKAFPDALAGSYLASVTGAPILLTGGTVEIDEKTGEPAETASTPGSIGWTAAYVRRNLREGGTVYILGGDAAVPADMETALRGLKVVRLAGAGRYETNLDILREAGVAGKDILIASGSGFADSLSASSVGLPILLVGDTLTQAQLQLLAEGSGHFIIVGGESAVSKAVETTLAELGTVERLSGTNRYATSALVASRFFPEADTMILACGSNFPDGLCGGPLAGVMGAPVLLVREGSGKYATEYRTVHAIKRGVILGGSSAVSDKAVSEVFKTE